MAIDKPVVSPVVAAGKNAPIKDRANGISGFKGPTTSSGFHALFSHRVVAEHARGS